MGKIERFEDLECWQSARQLTKHVYLICSRAPLNKDYNTVKQIKTAALSTMNNIAEGFARYNKKDFVRFLDYTKASASEVKSMTYVLEDLELLDNNEIKILRDECEKVSSLTSGLIRYIKKSI